MSRDHGFSRKCPTGDSFEDMQPPEFINCPKCMGDGEIETGVVLFDGEFEIIPCPECEGKGRIIK